MPTTTTVADICLSFPILPHPCIERDHNLKTIDQMFQSGARVVVVTGEADIGKTTTLAQFATSKTNSVLCFFLRSISDLGYDPVQLRFDLCSQINFILDGVPLDVASVPSQAEARQAILRLVRHARQVRNTLYFLVDGITDIPESNNEALEWFCDILPLNMESFRILLSGDVERLPPAIRMSAGLKPFVLGGFSTEEQRRALTGCDLSDFDLAQLCRFCGGSPGVTQSVRRLLTQGHEPKAILDLESDEARNLFRIEWKKLRLQDEEQLVVLTLLAFFPNRSTDQSISDLTGYPTERIREAVANLSFVRQDAETGAMMIASESVRRFAQSMLDQNKAKALDVVIANLRTKPATSQVTLLPEFLHHRGEWQALLDLFDTEKLALLVRESRSLGVAISRSAAIADVARSIGDWPSTIRFQIFETTLRSVLDTPAVQEELDFALAENDISNALRIATTNPNAEIRLGQFAKLAKHQFVREGRVSAEVGQEIDKLSKLIDPDQLGDECLSIASDLLLALPSVSADLVSRLAGTGEMANSLDVAIAKLSQRALRDEFTHEFHDKTLKAIADIAAPTLRQRLGAFSELFSKGADAERIYEATRRIPHASDRLWLVRGWLQENSARPDAVSLALRICREIVGDPLYSPNAGVFFDLSRPLIANPSNQYSQELSDLLRSQVPAISSIGPTVDAYRVREVLITYEHCIGSSSVQAAIDDLLLSTESLKDPATRAAVLAALYGRRDVRASDGRSILEFYGSATYVIDGLRTETARLLAGTFEHDIVLNDVLAGIAYCDWKDIEQIVAQVNTVSRRDAALVRVIRAMCRQHEADGACSASWWEKLETALTTIEGIEAHDRARSEIIGTLCTRITKISDRDIQKLEAIAREINSARRRARGLASVLAIYSDSLAVTQPVSSLLASIIDALQSIDGKKECGRTMLKCYIDVAKKSQERAIALREGCATRLLGIDQMGSSYWAVIANLGTLTCKVYAVLEAAGIVTDIDRRRLERSVDFIDPLYVKLDLWASTALRLFISGGENYKSIWREKVEPLLRRLEAFKAVDLKHWSEAVVRMFPLAWTVNQAAAKTLLLQVPVELQEQAVSDTVDLVIRKKIPGDAFEAPPDTLWLLTRAKIDELLELATITKNDDILHRVSSAILRFLSSQQGRSECTQGAREEYANRIAKLFSSVLPSRERHIKHDGYLILCNAELCKYRKADDKSWELLIAQAVSLPNSADRVFVLTVLTRMIPSHMSALRSRAYGLAEAELKNIESIDDRISRATNLCELAPPELQERVKGTCSLAFEYIKQLPEDRYEDALRQYIDSIYRVDPAIAESIAALTENDPARKAAKRIAREQLDIQKQSTGTGLAKIGDVRGHEKLRQLNQACWKQLGRLNATRASPLGAAAIDQMFASAAKSSIYNSYGVSSLAISAASVSFRSAEQLKEKILPMFHALLDAHALCEELFPFLASTATATTGTDDNEVQESRYSKAIEPGHRQEANDTLVRWLIDMQPTRVLICDPYIEDIEDLDAIRLVVDAVPGAAVEMLVGANFRKFMEKSGRSEESLSRELADRWGAEKVPYLRIVCASIPRTGQSPVHDRWWLTEKGAIELGTSFSGLGAERLTKIRLVTRDDIEEDERLIEELIRGERRQHRGEWISYHSYTVLPGSVN